MKGSKELVLEYLEQELLKNNNKLTNYFDVMLAWYVLGTESSQDLENIIFSELGENIEKFEDQFKKRKIDFGCTTFGLGVAYLTDRIVS